MKPRIAMGCRTQPKAVLPSSDFGEKPVSGVCMGVRWMHREHHVSGRGAGDVLCRVNMQADTVKTVSRRMRMETPCFSGAKGEW